MEAIDPDAYVVDDSGFVKDGTASPCVARQYSGTLGKTGNCQIGMSVQMVTDSASLAGPPRSFIGWHRHVTLAVLAQAFCTLLRLDPKADAPT